MGRRRRLRIRVKVVPHGGLNPNARHPYREESPRVRREGMIRALIRGLVAVNARRRAPAGQSNAAPGDEPSGGSRE